MGTKLSRMLFVMKFRMIARLLLIVVLFGPTDGISFHTNKWIPSNDDGHERKEATARMLGLDTGNPAADFEAEMWIAALIGTLTAAIPIAFLNPSLGFRRRRRALDNENLVRRHYFGN